MRLGLRYVRGLREQAARALVRERAGGGPFRSVDELARRVPALHKDELLVLAEVGALNSLGGRQNFHRRDALWQVERATRPAGPLLERVPAEQEDDDSPLQRMSDEERLIADFRGTGLTVGPHPMAFHRARLQKMGVRRAADLEKLQHNRTTRIAGCVIARQRPGTAHGFVFLSIEDESGIANAIITPDLFDRYRYLITGAKFLMVEGKLQSLEGVISIRAERVSSLPLEEIETRSHDFH